MVLHHTHHQGSLDDIFASTDLSVSAPKWEVPQCPMDKQHAYRIISDELMLDGNSRLNMATFCGTWMEDMVQCLLAQTFDKSMVDRDECP